METKMIGKDKKNGKLKAQITEAELPGMTDESPVGSDEIKPNEPDLHQAPTLLSHAVNIMKERGQNYDCKEGERSMAKTVKMFTALTGIEMTEEQGWKFMACLKLVRSETGNNAHADNYIDGAAYFALAGETALKK
jgi:hypothetical protein